MPEHPIHCKTDDKDESARIYLDVIWDKNIHPFPQPPLPEEKITETTENHTKCGGLRKDLHPFELPAIPNNEEPTEENTIYDQLDYWPIGQWPKFRKSWKERLNPLQLRNKTIFVIVLIAVSSIIVATTFITRFLVKQNTQNEDNCPTLVNCSFCIGINSELSKDLSVH